MYHHEADRGLGSEHLTPVYTNGQAYVLYWPDCGGRSESEVTQSESRHIEPDIEDTQICVAGSRDVIPGGLRRSGSLADELFL